MMAPYVSGGVDSIIRYRRCFNSLSQTRYKTKNVIETFEEEWYKAQMYLMVVTVCSTVHSNTREESGKDKL